MSETDLRSKLEELWTLKEAKKALERSLADTKSKCSDVEQQAIDLMVDLDMARVDIPDMASFSVSTSKHPRCVDHDLLRSKLMEMGLEHMLRMNPQTLKSWYRNDLTAAEQASAETELGIVVFPQSRINIRNK